MGTANAQPPLDTGGGSDTGKIIPGRPLIGPYECSKPDCGKPYWHPKSICTGESWPFAHEPCRVQPTDLGDEEDEDGDGVVEEEEGEEVTEEWRLLVRI